MDATFGNAERHLKDEGFEVLHLHRDLREDEWDDGGFIVSISKKNDKIYLHVLQISYNCGLSQYILDENDKRLEAELWMDIKDFFICEDIEEAQYRIDRLTTDLDLLIEEDTCYGAIWSYPEDGGHLSKEIISKLYSSNKFYIMMLAAMLSAYGDSNYLDRSQPNQDKIALRKLTSTPYTPNFKECVNSDDDED